MRHAPPNAPPRASILPLASTLAFALVLAGCGTVREVGRAPALSPADLPPTVHSAATHPAATPAAPPTTTGSLWRPGSLYAAERAGAVGDLVTVLVAIDDRGSFRNQTDRRRSNAAARNLSASAEASGLARVPFMSGELGFGGRTDHAGSGRTQRGESVFLRIAAHVEAVLPNGNLALRGSQEVMLNHELRRLEVIGIARARDLTAGNTVAYDRLGSARISYGGRGRLSEVQQPPWGQQLLDLGSPI